jgi:threonyl-tRNA synthetase
MGDSTVTVQGHQFVSTPMSLLPAGSPLLKSALVCLVDGKLTDLHAPLEAAGSIQYLEFDHPLAQETLWHSSAHVLGQALELYYKDHQVSLSDGPALADGGFFYDVHIQDAQGAPVTVSSEDLPGIQKLARQLLHKKQRFQRLVVPVAFARRLLRHNSFKLHTLDQIVQRAADAGEPSDESSLTVSLYRCGSLVDLCRGPHLPRTDYAPALQLTKTSSSVLKNPVPARGELLTAPGPAALDSVQRVYGVAFPTSELLAQHQERMRLAAEADHRRLGRVQELFMFHPLSPGCAFFLPHGTRVYNRLLDFLRGEYRRRGYHEVRTPQIFDKALWERSGHWQNYAEDMFYVSKGHVTAPADAQATVAAAAAAAAAAAPVPSLSAAELQCVHAGAQPLHESAGDVVSAGTCAHHADASPGRDSATQALKPMNCPGHCLLFGATARSYRDLPLRVADFSTLHRNEVSGALTGLTRVRAFAQDDAHVFCTPEQLAEELRACLAFIGDVYACFGFPLTYKLSTRPSHFIGEPAQWDAAEDALKSLLDEAAVTWAENPGDGAFYGPKVDVTVRDALGRQHQCATIQLDFNLPRRFGLAYRGADGAEHTPVMIHRAILGSVERFMAVLLEHTAGKWPLWLSPRQVFLAVVGDAQLDYAHDVRRRLEARGYYVDVADASLRLPKQVKLAQPLQYNYILTLGPAEAQADTVSVRPRGAYSAEPEPLSVEAFLDRLDDEVARKL